jgi:hypothetical protein
LKSHPWFEEFNWNELLNQNNSRLEPPYIPDKKSSVSKKEIIGKTNIRLLDHLRELELEQNLTDNDFGDKESFSWSSFGEFILENSDDLDDDMRVD